VPMVDGQLLQLLQAQVIQGTGPSAGPGVRASAAAICSLRSLRLPDAGCDRHQSLELGGHPGCMRFLLCLLRNPLGIAGFCRWQSHLLHQGKRLPCIIDHPAIAVDTNYLPRCSPVAAVLTAQPS
jgi:hypothetical protein